MSDGLVRRLSAAPKDRKSWDAVREICCRTGDNGNPIAPERWGLFARIWIEPYQSLLPQWSYVAEADGQIAGYLTGCPDTERFERARYWRCTLPLAAAIALGRYRGVPGALALVRRALRAVPGTGADFDQRARAAGDRGYPAHLHINIDARYRSSGLGRRLVTRFLADLKSAGISGIHLFCGREPSGFYLRLGFEELERAEIGGTPVWLMVKRC